MTQLTFAPMVERRRVGQDIDPRGLVVDLFAGGGGASAGIEAALGRDVDIALNHDGVALAVHEANHPRTRHLEADIWEVRPKEATGGRPVWMLWASPDCKDHSNAKGSKPRDQKIRSLAWAVTRWAAAVRPALIFCENVSEFTGWGPLGQDGKRVPSKKGKTFRKWVSRLRNLGYFVEWRVLDASLYGAPTRRRRVFIVARCDGEPIVWPEPSHGPGRLPLRTAAACIDWSLPCPSIFERSTPLAEKTMWRIAQGIRRFVFENPKPFIVKVNHGKREDRSEPVDEPLSTVTAERRGHSVVVPHLTKFQQNSVGQELREPMDTVMAGATRFGLLAPTLVQTGYGEREGQRPRSLDLQAPLGTVVGCGQKHALVAAWLAKHFGDPKRSDGGGGTVIGSELDQPIGTVTTRDHHSLAAVTLATFRGTDPGQPGSRSIEEPLPTISGGGIHVGEVRAFLSAYYGNDATSGQLLSEPMRTVTSKHHLGLVTVHGVDYQIVDIGFRMLEPHELLRAQFGRFAASYDLSAAKSKAAKVRLVGNSVCPEIAEALVRANVPRGAVRAA